MGFFWLIGFTPFANLPIQKRHYNSYIRSCVIVIMFSISSIFCLLPSFSYLLPRVKLANQSLDSLELGGGDLAAAGHAVSDLDTAESASPPTGLLVIPNLSTRMPIVALRQTPTRRARPHVRIACRHRTRASSPFSTASMPDLRLIVVLNLADARSTRDAPSSHATTSRLSFRTQRPHAPPSLHVAFLARHCDRYEAAPLSLSLS